MRHQPNLVPIGRTVEETWPFFSFFQDGGVRHLRLEKLKFLTHEPVQRAYMHQRVEFCVDHCGDMADFRFFKMEPVRHLGFVLRVF